MKNDFEKVSKWLFIIYGILALCSIAISVTVLGFIGWAVVKTMQHYSII